MKKTILSALALMAGVLTMAARRDNGKRGDFNILRAFVALCFAAIIGINPFANNHVGSSSTTFSGNAAWALTVICPEGSTYSVNGQSRPCPSPSVAPNAEAQELEKAGAQITKNAERAAQEADFRAAEASRAAQHASIHANATKRAVDEAKRRLNAANAAVTNARRVDARCTATANNNLELSNCERSRLLATQAARKVQIEAKKAVRQAANAANKAARDAKKAERAAKKAMALAQIERDYAACVAIANGDSTALAACKKSRDSKIKAAR